MAYLSKLGTILLGAVAATAFLGSAAVMAQDQTNSAQPNGTTGTASAIDPKAGYNSPDGNSDFFSDPMAPMDLIHRAVLMNNMSLSEFRSQQQDRISSEAANFRQRQQEALRQQASPADAAATPQPSTGTP